MKKTVFVKSGGRWFHATSTASRCNADEVVGVVKKHTLELANFTITMLSGESIREGNIKSRLGMFVNEH